VQPKRYLVQNIVDLSIFAMALPASYLSLPLSTELNPEYDAMGSGRVKFEVETAAKEKCAAPLASIAFMQLSTWPTEVPVILRPHSY